MDGLLMIVISAVTPWLLERLKWQRWFPLMQPIAPVLNRVTPLILAAGVAAGITFNVDASGWTLSGPLPEDMLRGALLWVGGAVVQHASYHRAIKDY